MTLSITDLQNRYNGDVAREIYETLPVYNALPFLLDDSLKARLDTALSVREEEVATFLMNAVLNEAPHGMEVGIDTGGKLSLASDNPNPKIVDRVSKHYWLLCYGEALGNVPAVESLTYNPSEHDSEIDGLDLTTLAEWVRRFRNKTVALEGRNSAYLVGNMLINRLIVRSALLTEQSIDEVQTSTLISWLKRTEDIFDIKPA